VADALDQGTRVPGAPIQANILSAQAENLLVATLAAGQPGLQRENGIFPNSPDSRETPADARGTSPAVWPGQLLSADQARTWFSGYYERFVVPYGGAFRHEDNNFWPFGGLEIAHASLYAGLPDQTNAILVWQLDHVTGKGVWAWGDEVSQDASQLIGGDMPHDWVAAEYVDLVRDMLVYESGGSYQSAGALQLAAGVPASWIPDGAPGVAVKSLPTYFGAISYQLVRAGSTITLDLQMQTPPSAGFDLRLPFELADVSIDGAAPAAARSQPVRLPPTAKHVVAHLKPA
jgi:hypothetical protein